MYGITNCIRLIHPDFAPNIGGADTNLRKEFPTIGDILFYDKEPRDFVSIVNELSPSFIQIILGQIDGLTTRKLGEIIGIENNMDAKIVKDELIRLKDPYWGHPGKIKETSICIWIQ